MIPNKQEVERLPGLLDQELIYLHRLIEAGKVEEAKEVLFYLYSALNAIRIVIFKGPSAHGMRGETAGFIGHQIMGILAAIGGIEVSDLEAASAALLRVHMGLPELRETLRKYLEALEVPE